MYEMHTVHTCMNYYHGNIVFLNYLIEGIEYTCTD